MAMGVDFATMSVDWKLSWNIGANKVTMRVVVTVSVALFDKAAVRVTVSGKVLYNKSKVFPLQVGSGTTVVVEATAVQVFPLRFAHSKPLYSDMISLILQFPHGGPAVAYLSPKSGLTSDNSPQLPPPVGD